MKNLYLVPVVPLPDESLASYLRRVCFANAILKHAWLYALLFEQTGIRCRTWLDVAAAPKALRALETMMQLRPGTLAPFGLRRLQTAWDPLFRDGDVDWPLKAIASDIDPYCPHCLSEDSRIGLKSWWLMHAPVCVSHEIRLVDTCTGCQEPLSPKRTSTSLCDNCGQDLRACDSTPVNEWGVKAAAVLQSGQTVDFGTSISSEPISADELFHVFTALLVPVGTDGMLGTDCLAKDAVIHALERLGSCITEGRIDSVSLAQHALKKWGHLASLGDKVQRQRLENVCTSIELLPTLQRLLLCGDKTEPASVAQAQYGGRPPRIFTVEKAAEFVGISTRDLLVCGEVRSRISSPLSGEGYDIDELHAVKEMVSELFDTSAADVVLGVNGASQTLMKMGLLVSWNLEDSCGRNIHPDAIADVYDRVLGVIGPVPEDVSGPLLSATANALGVDAYELQRIFGALFQGALTIHGWNPKLGLGGLQMGMFVTVPDMRDSGNQPAKTAL